jgi:hypothetical protein
MITRIAIALALITSVAGATERQPSRCYIVTEAGKPSRMVCDIPPSEACIEATFVRADGAIVTHHVCTTEAR